MKDQHIPQNELLATADGELDGARAAEVREHLSACWTCRARMKEIEDAIADFVHAHQNAVPVPLADGPRAQFRARLTDLALQPPPTLRERFGDFFLEGNRLAWTGGLMAAATGILVVIGIIQVSHQQFRLTPDPTLTPGATLPVSEAEVCASPEPRFIQAHAVSAKVGRRVFDMYGIDRPKARDYEMDYLIDPELGGADDPRNFWPQPYGVSEWNAHVKDALEDHLHELVCANKLSLATAQHDISSDWIGAYKKYFQTQRPFASHEKFTKDSPWEP